LAGEPVLYVVYTARIVGSHITLKLRVPALITFRARNVVGKPDPRSINLVRALAFMTSIQSYFLSISSLYFVISFDFDDFHILNSLLEKSAKSSRDHAIVISQKDWICSQLKTIHLRAMNWLAEYFLLSILLRLNLIRLTQRVNHSPPALL
jgi:hypothetical protein